MITQHNQRVIFSDNGSLEDITLRVNDYFKGDFDIGGYVPGEDYIYIGSDLPFSNKYFCLETPNTSSAKPSIQIWQGNTWVNAVDVLDDSDAGYDGKSLSRDGVISWKPDDDFSSWHKENDTKDIPELSALRIFCMYWLRISWDNSFSNGTTITHIGYDFAGTDQSLFAYYPDLNNQSFLDCFVPHLPSGTKTTWKEQRLSASVNVCNYLRGKDIILSPAQLLDYEIFRQAAIHETARIIYAGLDTEAYAEDYKRAGERFGRAINMKKFNIDENCTGALENVEKGISTGFMSR